MSNEWILKSYNSKRGVVRIEDRGFVNQIKLCSRVPHVIIESFKGAIPLLLVGLMYNYSMRILVLITS